MSWREETNIHSKVHEFVALCMGISSTIGWVQGGVFLTKFFFFPKGKNKNEMISKGFICQKE